MGGRRRRVEPSGPRAQASRRAADRGRRSSLNPVTSRRSFQYRKGIADHSLCYVFSTPLDRDHTASGKTFTIPDTIDIVNDRNRRFTRPEEISMQGMTGSVRDRSKGSNQGLSYHLAAEDPGWSQRLGNSAKEIMFYLLQIEVL